MTKWADIIDGDTFFILKSDGEPNTNFTFTRRGDVLVCVAPEKWADTEATDLNPTKMNYILESEIVNGL